LSKPSLLYPLLFIFLLLGSDALLKLHRIPFCSLASGFPCVLLGTPSSFLPCSFASSFPTLAYPDTTSRCSSSGFVNVVCLPVVRRLRLSLPSRCPTPSLVRHRFYQYRWFRLHHGFTLFTTRVLLSFSIQTRFLSARSLRPRVTKQVALYLVHLSFAIDRDPWSPPVCIRPASLFFGERYWFICSF